MAPNGAVAYVANGDDVTPINLSSGTPTLEHAISVPNGPLGIAVTPSGTMAYTANTDDTVTPINLSTTPARAPARILRGQHHAARRHRDLAGRGDGVRRQRDQHGDANRHRREDAASGGAGPGWIGQFRHRHRAGPSAVGASLGHLGPGGPDPRSSTPPARTSLGNADRALRLEVRRRHVGDDDHGDDVARLRQTRHVRGVRDRGGRRRDVDFDDVHRSDREQQRQSFGRGATLVERRVRAAFVAVVGPAGHRHHAARPDVQTRCARP